MGEPKTVMSESDAEAFVIDLLRRRGHLTTMQIEVLAGKEHKRCPDQTVIFLMKMKRKGMIDGQASLESKGWLWSLPQRASTASPMSSPGGQ